jgi:exopolysaccharide biosynthesis polyprenyl glycosylphosphotransferase
VVTAEQTASGGSARPVVAMPIYLSATTTGRRTGPLTSYRRWVAVADLAVVAAATTIGYLARFGLPHSVGEAIAPYRALGLGMVLLWLFALYARGSYDVRFLGVGPEEFNRILMSTILVFALVAGIGYFTNSDVSRAYVFISLPLGLLLLLAERWILRRFLYRARRHGVACYRTIVLGSHEQVAALSDELSKDAYAGYVVVGSLPPPDAGHAHLDAWLAQLSALVAESGADAVAVTPDTRIDRDAVRRIGWTLQGRGIDLLVAPAFGDVAGPRISMRPAAGLPLLHLEEPGLTSAQALGKRTLDIVGSALGLVVLAPVLAVIAIAVRVTTPGPALFRQWRVGLAGRTFLILKFRTMTASSDAARGQLRDEVGHHGPGFKHKADPRVTRVGRFLRRWSLDELPQLVNVLRNDMSLVGPRPHPIDDVERYGERDFRRLMAKPGITGLWQVEGRSDLDWNESVQLDLYYIENWSWTGDIVLMVRTIRAVLIGRGAA